MRWVIGDIHGMFRPLGTLLNAIEKQDKKAELLFCGDYVNRGPDSKLVLELLISLRNARFVRGNHDDIFDLILHNECYAENAASGSPTKAFQWFIDYGLDTTFHSYGADWDWLHALAHKPTKQKIASLAESVPPEHRAFVRSLPPVIEFDDIFIAHGKWAIGQKTEAPNLETMLSGSKQLRQTLLWGRYEDAEVHAEKPWRRRGFFGHTPVFTYKITHEEGRMIPVVGPRIVLLDTACALGTFGRLTAYCVEEESILQVDHFGKMVHEK
jgi:serine/threonine protein phosphatase 1